MKSCFLFASLIIILSSCTEGSHNNDITGKDTTAVSDTNRTVNTTHDDHKDMDEFREDSKKRMEQLDRRIDSLEVKWNQQRAENKEKYAVKRDEMKKRSRELRTRLDSTRKRSDENWEEFKEEFRHDMDKLGKSIDDFFEDNK